MSLQETLERLHETKESIQTSPYCLNLYMLLAQQYLDLAYPDLAAGAAYKALLLSDALQDEGDEFHERAVESFHHLIPAASAKGLSDIDSSDFHIQNGAEGRSSILVALRSKYLLIM